MEQNTFERIQEGQSLHGGDIYRYRPKLDFSVNSNPFGMPASVRQALMEAVEQCSAYPELSSGRLRQAIAGRYPVAAEDIVCGNGASELFLALVHAIRPRRTVIPVPSFYGYEKAAQAAEGEIVFYEMKEAAGFGPEEGILQVLTKDTDLLFMANPNNPTGRLIEKGIYQRILEVCRQNDIRVVVDECFLEFCEREEELSLLGKLQNDPHVTVVRAFTKTYAMPGVRLGWLVVTEEALKKKLLLHLPEWNVSLPAQRAGEAACLETDYVTDTVRLLEQEKRMLAEGLCRLGIRVYPSDTAFLLLQTDRPIWEKLLERRVLIRDCENFRGLGKGFYRIAVKESQDNRKLLEICREIL